VGWSDKKRVKAQLAATTAPPPPATPTPTRPSLGSRLKSIREAKEREKKLLEQQKQQLVDQQLAAQQLVDQQLAAAQQLAEGAGEEEAMATAKTSQHVNVYREEVAASALLHKGEKARFPPKVPESSLKVRKACGKFSFFNSVSSCLD
jgi:hypothetical protein